MGLGNLASEGNDANGEQDGKASYPQHLLLVGDGQGRRENGNSGGRERTGDGRGDERRELVDGSNAKGGDVFLIKVKIHQPMKPWTRPPWGLGRETYLPFA